MFGERRADGARLQSPVQILGVNHLRLGLASLSCGVVRIGANALMAVNNTSMRQELENINTLKALTSDWICAKHSVYIGRQVRFLQIML